MLTLLGSLPFLIALAVAGGTLITLLRADGDKMMAALRGESPLSTPLLTTRPVTVRFASRPEREVIRRPAPQWRAAA